MSIRVAVSLVCLSSVCSSVGLIYAGELVHQAPPLLAVGMSYLLAGVLFVITDVVRKEKINFVAIYRYRKELLAYTLSRAFGAGLLAYALFLTTSAKVVFFAKIEPYLVMFWMWMMHKEKPNSKNILLLFVHITGAVFLSMGDFKPIGHEQYGDLLMLGAITCFSFSYPIVKNLSKEVDPISISAIANVSSALFLYLAYCGYHGGFVAIPYINPYYGFMQGAVGLYIGIGLWLYTVKSLEPWIASSLRTLGPIVAAPVAWIVFDQKLTLTQIAGAAVVIVTSALISRQHRPAVNK
jgi:drug/metabolite transporter (DMT)-like permease